MIFWADWNVVGVVYIQSCFQSSEAQDGGYGRGASKNLSNGYSF